MPFDCLYEYGSPADYQKVREGYMRQMQELMAFSEDLSPSLLEQRPDAAIDGYCQDARQGSMSDHLQLERVRNASIQPSDGPISISSGSEEDAIVPTKANPALPTGPRSQELPKGPKVPQLPTGPRHQELATRPRVRDLPTGPRLSQRAVSKAIEPAQGCLSEHAGHTKSPQRPSKRGLPREEDPPARKKSRRADLKAASKLPLHLDWRSVPECVSLHRSNGRRYHLAVHDFARSFQLS